MKIIHRNLLASLLAWSGSVRAADELATRTRCFYR
jgi:hypothetical protein